MNMKKLKKRSEKLEIYVYSYSSLIFTKEKIDKQLQSDIAKRVKIQFGNHMELDRAIEKKNEKATQVFYNNKEFNYFSYFKTVI